MNLLKKTLDYMERNKRLQDLTIKDNFMFCAVMSVEENCTRFLEMVLGFPISRIDVSYERNMVYHPEYKGIRLDVYAKDQNNKRYNVEIFVIFLCDYDPFGRGLYCYTCAMQCKEDASVECDDGCQTIYLSTKGKNTEKIPESLVRFLKFVAADIEQSESDFEDEFVGQLQKSIHNVKESREMGERYMIFEEMMRDERKAGREE